jgi:peptidoglycan DL-endopeptidase CwlO
MCRIVSDAERAMRTSTPMSRLTRRVYATTVSAVATSAVVAMGLFAFAGARPAGADQIADLQAQAAQLQQSISTTNSQLEATGQQYDAAQAKLSQINGQISATKQQIAADQAKVAQDIAILRKASVNAYVTDGSAATENPLFAKNQQELGSMQVYNSVAEGDLSTAVAQLHTDQTQLNTQQTQLQTQQSNAQDQVDAAQQAKQQESQLVQQQQSELSQDTGQIATLVAQRQAAEAAAEQAATQARLAAAQQQQQQQQQPTSTQVTAQGPGGNGPAGTTTTTAPPTTSADSSSTTSGGGGSPNSQATFTAPPGASGASVAVQAALSQVGVPYVTGGRTPGVGFDCSGLTSWAWGQAGVSLTPYSGAQMQETAPVPVSDLEPGDLLFYGPGGDTHVAMYIGNGQQVEATTPGSTVMVNPLRLTDDFAGAGRP